MVHGEGATQQTKDWIISGFMDCLTVLRILAKSLRLDIKPEFLGFRLT